MNRRLVLTITTVDDSGKRTAGFDSETNASVLQGDFYPKDLELVADLIRLIREECKYGPDRRRRRQWAADSWERFFQQLSEKISELPT